MDALATFEDVNAYLAATDGEPFEEADRTGVEMALDAVSNALRADTGQSISQTDSTYTDWFSGFTHEIVLPQQPVQSVGEVRLDGAIVLDWQLRNGRLWRPRGWYSTYGPGCSFGVTVTFTHGFETVPADVVRFVCMAVADGSDGAVPARSEQVAEYSYTLDANAEPGSLLAMAHSDIVRRYSYGRVSRKAGAVRTGGWSRGFRAAWPGRGLT